MAQPGGAVGEVAQFQPEHEGEGDRRGAGIEQGGDPAWAGHAHRVEHPGKDAQEGVAPEAAKAFRQGPGRRRRRQGQGGGEGEHGDGDGEQVGLSPAGLRRLPRGADHPAQDQQHGHDPGRDAERLHADVRQGGPQPPGEVRGHAVSGGVEAGIGGVVTGERQGQDQAAQGLEASAQA